MLEPERYAHPLPALVLEDFFYTSGEEQNLLYGDLTGIRLPMPELKRIHRAALEALDIRYIYNENVKVAATELTEQALEEEDGFLSEAGCE